MNATEEPRFNLIYEKWIPVASGEKVSLSDIFSGNTIANLGGNIIDIISILRLLLAVSQRAFTPNDEEEWEKMDIEGFKSRVMAYLKENEDLFYLYHPEHPFMQVKSVANTTPLAFSRLSVLFPSDNAPIVTDCQQMDSFLSDEEKAVLLLSALIFAPFSKRGGDGKALLPSPVLGKRGYLHVFFTAGSLVETIYANLFTLEEIGQMPGLRCGLGEPLWELLAANNGVVPNEEKIVYSYLGRLVPLTRSILIDGDGAHYRKGIDYPGPEEGVFEPTMVIETREKKGQVPLEALTVDPVKKPWRYLTSFLSISIGRHSENYSCPVIKACLRRAVERFNWVDIIAGGLKIKVKSGETSVSRKNDFVLSRIHLAREDMQETWFSHLEKLGEDLSGISERLKKAIGKYARDVGMDKQSKGLVSAAEQMFWDRMDHILDEIVSACEEDESVRKRLITRIQRIANEIYDITCPHTGIKEFMCWVKNRPFSVT